MQAGREEGCWEPVRQNSTVNTRSLWFASCTSSLTALPTPCPIAGCTWGPRRGLPPLMWTPWRGAASPALSCAESCRAVRRRQPSARCPSACGHLAEQLRERGRPPILVQHSTAARQALRQRQILTCGRPQMAGRGRQVAGSRRRTLEPAGQPSFFSTPCPLESGTWRGDTPPPSAIWLVRRPRSGAPLSDAANEYACRAQPPPPPLSHLRPLS